MGLLGQIIILVLVFGPRVIQSEVSQNEKDKYYILVHACESRKMVQTNLFAGREQRCRHGEQTYGQGSGVVNWESRTDIPTVPWVNQIASGNLLYNTESSAPYSLVTQRGGREIQDGGDIYIHRADSLHCTQETSNITMLQL